MVLLVLKLFVSSHPLKLEGVLCIYVLLVHVTSKIIVLLSLTYSRRAGVKLGDA
jgi:hypothetical protein